MRSSYPGSIVCVFACLVSLVSCGGGSESPTSPTSNPTPTPQAQTFTLSGRVTETAPTQTTVVVGATVSVVDGANAGKSAVSDSTGNYSIAGLQRGGFTVNATAEGYAGTSTGVDLTANRTQNFALALSGPRNRFGAGQYLVGSEISAGRYFSDPADGCYWERQSGLGGTLNDILANDFVSFNAMQIIVDISPSDRAFETDNGCGTWFNSPRHGQQATIQPGTWLVGNQIPPGTYRTNAGAGCYWERQRDFSGNLNGIIANDFVSGGGSQLVEVRNGDTGFHSDADCGTWTRVSSMTETAAETQQVQTREAIEGRRRHNRQQHGLSGR
jgi:hypothetical protein